MTVLNPKYPRFSSGDTIIMTLSYHAGKFGDVMMPIDTVMISALDKTEKAAYLVTYTSISIVSHDVVGHHDRQQCTLRPLATQCSV